MGVQLDEYYDNLILSQQTIGSIDTALGYSQKYIKAMKYAIGRVEKAISTFNNMDDLADNLQSAMRILKLFPPLKTIARLIERAIDSMQDGSGTFLDRMEDIERSLKDYKEAMDETNDRLKIIKYDLKLLNQDIASAIPGIESVQTVFDSAGESAPPSLAAIETDLEDGLATINAAFNLLPKQQIADLNAKITAFQNMVSEFASLSSALDLVTDAVAAIYNKLRFLDAPLEKLVDAVDGYMWVLELAEKLISKILDPIVDPILEATGVYDLIDRLVASVKNLLPDYDVDLLEFANIGDDLLAIFGNIPAGPDWEIPLVAEMQELRDDILAAFQGVSGYLGPIFGGGSADADLLIGRTDIIGGFDASIPVFFDGLAGRDVIKGGSRSDILNGGADDDLIIASGGDDTIDGGTGTGDIFATTGGFSDYAWWFDDTSFYLNYVGTDRDLVGSAELTNIEYLMMNGATFRTADLREVIKGTDGEATEINGTAGDDLIFGGHGVDLTMPDMVELNGGLASGDYLMAGNVAMPTAELAIEFLMQGNLPDDGKSYAIVSYGVTGSANEWTLFVTEVDGIQQLRLIVNGQPFDTGIDAGLLLDGNIHRLSINWSSTPDSPGGYANFYIDGVFADGTARVDGAYGDPITSGGVLVFGQDQDGTPGDTSRFNANQEFVGSIGDIRVFDRLLTREEIFHNAFVPLESPESMDELVHFWSVDANGETITTNKGATLAATGPSGSDFIEAPVSRVYISIDEGGDTINGHGGDDRITGFGGRDVIDGGSGIDTIDYSAEAFGGGFYPIIVLDPTHAVRTDPANEYYDWQIDNLFNIENAVGSQRGDLIIGTDGDNRLSGRGGGDTIFGLDGNDIIIGGDGQDYGLVGGAGNDTLLGGGASDDYVAGLGFDHIIDTDATLYNTVFYSADDQGFVDSILDPYQPGDHDFFPDFVEVFAIDRSTFHVNKHRGDIVEQDTLEGAFKIWLSEGDDIINVNDFMEIVDGWKGNDLFISAQPTEGLLPDDIGAPSLYGGEGNDTLISYTGDENFIGQDGDDLAILRIVDGEDHAPDPDTGARERNLFVNTLDLRESEGLNWVFDMNAIGGGLNVLISTRDLEPGEANEYREADDFVAQDRFLIGAGTILGSEMSEVMTFATPNTIADANYSVTLESNGGDDYYWGFKNLGDVNLDLGDGDDFATTGFGVDTVRGGDGNDQIFAWGNEEAGHEIYEGGAGNDLIVFQQHSANNASYDFAGGEGLDFLDFSENGWLMDINLGAGTYSMNSGAIVGGFTGFEAVIGSDNENDITGDDAANIISGGRLSDEILAGDGDDVIFGGSYVNWYGPGDPTTLANDWLEGGLGNDLIHIHQGHSTVKGQDGVDTLRLAGQLRYSAILGFETIYVGASDLNELSIMEHRWNVDIGTGTGTLTSFGGHAGSGYVTGSVNFTGIEALIGGIFDDTLKADAAGHDTDNLDNGSDINGSDGDDSIIGLDGIDTLGGGRGNDAIFGGAGDDFLTPGAGFDAVSGDEGIDTLDLRQGSLSVTKESLLGSAIYDYDDISPILEGEDPGIISSFVSFSDVEIFNLSDHDDSWIGGAGAETIRGNGGDDVIEGGGGSDVLEGGAGDDHLVGSGAAQPALPDMLYMNQGGARNDYLTASGVAMPTGTFTFEFMVNGELEPATQNHAIFSYGVSGSTNEILLHVDNLAANNTVDIWVAGVGYDTGLDANLFMDGTDHRVSVTRDGATIEIYVDGVRVWTDTLESAFATALDGGGVLVIGQDQDGSTPGVASTYADNQAFIGGIGDIRIYSDVRTAEEIAANAAQALTNPGGDASLVHYWTVDAGGSQLVTQKGATLSVVGANTWAAGADGGTDAANLLNGGEGNDTLDAGNNGDVLFDGFGDNELNGGNGADVLTALSGSNILNGGASGDILQGGIGSDVLNGGSGNDILVADVSNFLFGNDTLEGGTGDDLLSGGLGADMFLFSPNHGTNTIGRLTIDYGDPGSSVISAADFEVGVDKIALSGFAYATTAEAYANVADAGPHAMFVDQNTAILFHGLTAGELSEDDFILV